HGVAVVRSARPECSRSAGEPGVMHTDGDCPACQALEDARVLFDIVEDLAKQSNADPVRIGRALLVLCGMWISTTAETTNGGELSDDDAAECVERAAADIRRVLAGYLAREET